MELTVLEKLIEEDFGLAINGDRWAHAIQHDSLVIDRAKQIFHWNSRNIRGDAYIYLTEVRNWMFEDAKEYLKRSNFSTVFITDIRNKKETIVYTKLVDVFHEELLKNDKEYFYKRTVTDETMSRFKLGYFDGFYMIPIEQDYALKQFQMRRDKPEKIIRNYYKNVGGCLYNSDAMRVTDIIAITEGLVSSIVLTQNGIPAVSSNTGALGFMMDWFPYFAHQKLVYLLYDNDNAGRTGAIRTAKILGEKRCRIYTFESEEEHYDANDFFIDGGTKEQLMSILNKDSRYSFELEKGVDNGNRKVFTLGKRSSSY